MRKLLFTRTLAATCVAAAIAMSIVSLPAADYSQFKSRMQAQLAAEQPRLSLSPEKSREFEAVINASIDRRVAILERHGVKPEGKNPPTIVRMALPEIEEANVKLRADLARILSEDQLKTFDAISDKLRKELIAALSGG
jgi:hypothetical protein